MSMELTVVKQGSPVAAIDLANLNFDIAQKWLDTQGGSRAFAGEQIAFNGQDGVYKIGFGAKAQELDEVELVVNFPHVMDCWQEWAGTAPTYPFIAQPFAGQALPRRDSLGDLDQSLWADDKFKKDSDGKKAKRDPWQQVMVLVARTPKGRLFHFMASTISTKMALTQLLRDAVVEAKRKPGQLPVVNFSSKKIKSDDGNYHVIDFKITGWVKAEASDNPAGGMLVSTDEAPEADDTEAKTVAKPRVKAEPKPAVEKPKAQARMLDAVTEDDTEEEVVKAAPRKRTLD